MIIAELPFKPFLALLRQCGVENRYPLLTIFLARHADCPWAFDEIDRCWSSLHDVTGTDMMFLTVDAKKSSPIAGWDLGCRLDDHTGRIHGDYGVVAFSSECRLLQELDLSNVHDRVGRWSQIADQDFVESHIRSRRRERSWSDDHTLGITSVLEALENVDEEDVPCLYFEFLHDNSSVTVPLPTFADGMSVYRSMKAFKSQSGSRLDELRSIVAEWNDLKVRLARSCTKPSLVKRITESREWLTEWLKNSDIPDLHIRAFVERCVKGDSSPDLVYKSIRSLQLQLTQYDFSKLRSHLNRLSALHISDKQSAIKRRVDGAHYTLDTLKAAISQDIRDSFGQLENLAISSQKRFRVALSFPGEHRSFVEQVAQDLAAKIGKKNVFYDKYYQAELARPNLDVFLLDVYTKLSEIVVVFLCEDYEKKEWCGLEARAIRDLIKRRRDSSIVIVRLGPGEVPGFLSIDGFIDGNEHSPAAISEFVIERLNGT